MEKNDDQNMQRIAKAIAYITENYQHQPSLEQIAAHVHLSPFHFQRLFGEFVGTTPKKFLQFTTVEYAKSLLRRDSHTLFETTYRVGLSGTSRLHDLFISVEGMTPAEYKHGGKGLTIYYDFYETVFGQLVIANTARGICHLAFVSSQQEQLNRLLHDFPAALMVRQSTAIQCDALHFFAGDWSQLVPLRLHLKGSEFQLKVWSALLQIPLGNVTTYGAIAAKIGSPKASRAVGTAIGSNPIAMLIPCHRVIQSTGKLGGYMWGEDRKKAIIGWEAVQTNEIDKM